VSATDRPTTPAPEQEQPTAPAVKRCLDCGAPLAGKFCDACGQCAQLRSLSLPTLTHDAIHDLAHLDSRVWRTLRALLLRPGYLTNEFLAGRRTRYLPPFRLYLVLSVIFFVLLSCKQPEDAIVLDGIDLGTDQAGVVTGKDRETLQQAMQELSHDIASEAAQAKRGNESTPSPVAETAEKTAAAITQAVIDPDSSVMPESDCNVTWGLPGRGWMEPQLNRVCENLKTVSKREFGHALLVNVPKMMFVFLPLLAFTNLLLYVFRRRKYVEHLLFYTHFHAFAFLLLTLQMLVMFVLGWFDSLRFVGSLVKFASVAYLFAALYKSMRHVYRQSALLTTLKYIVVLMTYGLSLLLTFIGTVFYTALTV